MIQVINMGLYLSAFKLMQAFDDRKLGFADCAADFRSACRFLSTNFARIHPSIDAGMHGPVLRGTS